MAEIIRPEAFNEQFALLDACGNPVQRSLSEMTADEVIDASLWLMDEFERLDRLAACEGQGLSLVHWLQIEHPRQAAAEEIMLRHLHLMNLLYVAMPEWREHSELSWHDALRRYWPHGCAA